MPLQITVPHLRKPWGDGGTQPDPRADGSHRDARPPVVAMDTGPAKGSRAVPAGDRAIEFFPQGLTGKLRNTRPLSPALAGTIRFGPGYGRLPRTRRAAPGVRGRRTGCPRVRESKRLRETPAVSETLARTSADGSQGGAPAPQQGRRPAWLTPVNLTIIIITLVALVLRVYYQYTRPGFLLGVTEYDDGPYFGSAVRLVHGSMPYRDFVLVQPPGITLLMSPVGLLTYWTGTAWGLAIGRILTRAGRYRRGRPRRAARAPPRAAGRPADLRDRGRLLRRRGRRAHGARRAVAGAVLPGRRGGGVRR